MIPGNQSDIMPWPFASRTRGDRANGGQMRVAGSTAMRRESVWSLVIARLSVDVAADGPQKRCSRRLIIRNLLVVAAVLGVPHLASAQFACDPQGVGRLIYDLQNGSLNWNALSPPISGVVLAQTGGTGRYPQLAAVGPPNRIDVIGVLPLPYGLVCGFRAFFPSAVVEWQVAFGFGQIQYFYFQQVATALQPVTPSSPPRVGAPSPGTPPPSQGPVPPGGGSGGVPDPRPREPLPPDTSAACKRFPTLC